MIQLCGLLLVACLVLGGSTYAGFLSDAVLQLLSIPVLMYALWLLPASMSSGSQPSRGIWTVLALCLAAVLLPVLQLLPLPPSIWTQLPGREPVIAAFGLIGQDLPYLPWMPLSLTPRATWVSALALLPPVAILLATATATGCGKKDVGSKSVDGWTKVEVLDEGTICIDRIVA